MTPRVELVAGGDEEGARLDVALAAHPDVASRATAQRLLDEGRVTVDGERRPKRHRLVRGETVVAEWEEPAGDEAVAAGAVPHAVVFEDESLIVVDKPAGVVVHPGAGHAGATLAGALAGRAAGGADPSRPGIVHRLDRDTSGLLVVAKSEAAHAELSAALRRRAVRREYLALVDGHPDALTGTIEAPVGRDRGDRTAVSLRTDRPREARTHFRRLEALPRTSLLELILDTGRTHQIRVHLQAIGHPVCGDPRYGGTACGARLGLGRQFLHSARLSFAHPLTGEPLAFASELPEDLRAGLEAARAEAPDRPGHPR